MQRKSVQDSTCKLGEAIFVDEDGKKPEFSVIYAKNFQVVARFIWFSYFLRIMIMRFDMY